MSKYRPKRIPHDTGYGSHARKRATKDLRPHVARAARAQEIGALQAETEYECRKRLFEAAGLKADFGDLVAAEAALVFNALEAKRPILTFVAEVICPGCGHPLRADQRGYGRGGTESYVSPRMRVKFKPASKEKHATKECDATLVLEKF